jgi:CheY-like chemotaxis protein
MVEHGVSRYSGEGLVSTVSGGSLGVTIATGTQPEFAVSTGVVIVHYYTQVNPPGDAAIWCCTVQYSTFPFVLQMPRMDGVTALQRIRTAEHRAGTTPFYVV